MLSTVTLPVRPSLPGEPVWELLELFPEQGRWTEQDYLKIDSNRFVELTDGRLELLPMPTFVHQQILTYMLLVLSSLEIDGERGVAVPPVFKVRLRKDLWREPDITYMLPGNRHRIQNAWWEYADLVVEVVSPDNPSRDYVEKRDNYAKAGIPEYWIVDPERETVTILSLDGNTYREAQVARRGEIACSLQVAGLTINVSEMMNQAKC